MVVMSILNKILNGIVLAIAIVIAIIVIIHAQGFNDKVVIHLQAIATTTKANVAKAATLKTDTTTLSTLVSSFANHMEQKLVLSSLTFPMEPAPMSMEVKSLSARVSISCLSLTIYISISMLGPYRIVRLFKLPMMKLLQIRSVVV
jgi:hypothetical protein